MASDRQQRYEERKYLHEGDREISPQAYNLILGGTLLYGFLVNCFMVEYCFSTAYSLIGEHYVAFLIGYIVLVVAGSLMVNGSSNPIISFLGYNLIVVPLGLVVSYVINIFNLTGYSSSVTYAFALTGAVTLIMMAISSLAPNFFLSLGRTLSITLLVTLVLELILYFAGAPLVIIDYIVVFIFCGYIGYDWARANACAKTIDNAVDFAAELYVDIINLFLRILSILARSNSD